MEMNANVDRKQATDSSGARKVQCLQEVFGWHGKILHFETYIKEKIGMKYHQKHNKEGAENLHPYLENQIKPKVSS